MRSLRLFAAAAVLAAVSVLGTSAAQADAKSLPTVKIQANSWQW